MTKLSNGLTAAQVDADLLQAKELFEGKTAAQLLLDTSSVQSALSLSEMIVSTKLKEGDTVVVSDRSYAKFKIVLASGVTANSFNVIALTGLPLLAAELQVQGDVQADHFGCVADLDVAALAATTNATTIANTITAATDNHLALTAALNYAILNHLPLVCGPGGYYVSESVVPVILPTSEAYQNRSGNINVKGVGITNTVFYSDAAAYVFDFSTGSLAVDVVSLSDCMLWSPNGGGIKTPDGMWRNYSRIFYHGAAPGFYGRFDDGDSGSSFGVYNINEVDCIYWNKNGYFGGAFYVNNFHTFSSKNTFISQNRLDGTVCKIEDGKSVCIDSIALEAVPNGSVPTNQVFIELAGTVTNVNIGNVYVEGVWNKVFWNSSSADKNIHIEMIFAWQRHISGLSDRNCQVYVGLNADAVNIKSLLYIADPSVAAPTANNYLVVDTTPDDSRISVERYENQTANGNGQTNRLLKRNKYAHRTARGGFRASKHIGYTTNPAYTFNLEGPGSYIVNINYISIDRNHGGAQSFIVTYDDAGSNDWTSVVEIAAVAAKSGQFTSMTVTVDSGGLVSVSSVATVQFWNVYYSANILSALPLENGNA